MTVFKTMEFDAWFKEQGVLVRKAVDARIERIVCDNHFGLCRRFGGITELKWSWGLRIYLVERRPDIILLLGGNKNGQEKDIWKAKKLLNKINAP